MAKDKLSVLVVDDDDDDLFLTCDCLSSITSYDITIDKESNYKTALEVIGKNKHDIYLIDYLLGPHTGIELITKCIKAGINKPFILLTGKGDHRVDIEAANAGAYDYLTKAELTPELLERSLRYSFQRYSAFIAMAESEYRYREIFNKSNDIIFVLDKQFRLVNFNPMMNSLLGYSSAELLHQPLQKFFDNPDLAENFIQHIKDHNAQNDIEAVLLDKDGSPKTFLASCSHITTPDGIGQYQGILYDYTNIKKSVMEQLLREKMETTELLVQSLAHEIRNPLTSINLSLHHLEQEVGEKEKVFTDIIKRNSGRINDMIADLMNLSTPVTKQEDKIELQALIQSVLYIATDRIKLKNIEISEKHPSEPVYLIGDLKKLQTALLNIVVNAVEAVDNANGKISIETSSFGNTIFIKIGDNGNGISPEHQTHLFQPYFTGKTGGMGLGLATSLSFILAHEGSIDVYSVPGNGSVFTVSLRAVPEQVVSTSEKLNVAVSAPAV